MWQTLFPVMVFMQKEYRKEWNDKAMSGIYRFLAFFV